MSGKSAASLLLAVLLVAPGLAAAAPRSLLTSRRIKEFYAAGGKPWVGKKIHIHIEASVFGKRPKKIRLPGGKVMLCYTKESVPLLVSPQNVYFRRLKRKKKISGLVCIKGSVIRPPWDLEGRCFIRVAVVKTYGGRLWKGDGKRDPKRL